MALRQVSPAGYDLAAQQYPGLCPLLWVAGDTRSGEALLAGLAADRAHAARALSPEGAWQWRRQLDRLAASLAPKLASAGLLTTSSGLEVVKGVPSLHGLHEPIGWMEPAQPRG